MVVVKWSMYSPSTQLVEVRIPLKCSLFIMQTMLDMNANEQKEAMSKNINIVNGRRQIM